MRGGPQVDITRSNVHKAVHKALKHWDSPTREGMEIFMRLKVAQEYGLQSNLSIVDCRIALNRMLTAHIEQLSRLQPILADILIRRFQNRETTKSIAFKMALSVEQTNRKQRLGIFFLAEFIFDEELRKDFK